MHLIDSFVGLADSESANNIVMQNNKSSMTRPGISIMSKRE